MEDVEINVQWKSEELRTITKTNVTCLMVVGWCFYLGSIIFNYVYFYFHPFSPELCFFGAEEEVKEWTPPNDTKGRDKSNIQPAASQIEMTELLRPEEN